jgi:16S rRNA U516 pseudouridylate synthase RsuA-like enzyme
MKNCNSRTKLKTFKTFIIEPRTKINNKNIRTKIDKSKDKRTNMHHLWKREKSRKKKKEMITSNKPTIIHHHTSSHKKKVHYDAFKNTVKRQVWPLDGVTCATKTSQMTTTRLF